MSASRRVIFMTSDEARLLEMLYLARRVPTDHYSKNPRLLAGLASDWNELTARGDSPGDILHYMFTRRKWQKHKDGKWPRLGSSHRKIASPSEDALTKEEWVILRDIYKEMNTGSDNFGFEGGLAKELERRFAARTDRRVPSTTLLGLIFAKRKRGEWEHITEVVREAFSDIDAVA